MTEGGKKQQSPKSGYKIFYTESDRPVFINPVTKEFILQCEGFGPITMELSNVYAVFREGAGSTVHGVKTMLYDGNGNRIRIVFNFTDSLVCSKMSDHFGPLFGPGCKVTTHHPKDSKDKSHVMEIGFCPKHLQELVSKHGPIIPSTRDLTPPSKQVSMHAPDLETMQSLLTKMSVNPTNQHPHPMFYETQKEGSENGKPTSSKGLPGQ